MARFMEYLQFKDKLEHRIITDDSFNYELLKTVIKNPKRYTGIFRLSNAKTKLIQNVTQSREIKFGDFMEDIVTDYIAIMGYTNLDKNIGNDEDGNALSADQVFKKGTENTVYLIEQKVRDDHDSTKKRGQFQNFKKKYMLLKRQFPNCKINATMWFIDDGLVKNKNYYISETVNNNVYGITQNILYGEELFTQIFKNVDVWKEICGYLKRNKQERSNEILTIPDFDTSIEMLEALKKVKTNDTNLYRKLISDKPEYIQLRAELFPTGKNLGQIKSK